MTVFTVGIDPDCEKHGVAVYKNLSLMELKMLGTIEMLGVLNMLKDFGDVKICIEETDANKFIYARNTKQSKTLQSKIAMGIGKNQQAQVELCRWLDYHGFDYVLQKPSKRNWANEKHRFEQHTGWTGRSNADTRSAAYFGFVILPRAK